MDSNQTEFLKYQNGGENPLIWTKIRLVPRMPSTTHDDYTQNKKKLFHNHSTTLHHSPPQSPNKIHHSSLHSPEFHSLMSFTSRDSPDHSFSYQEDACHRPSKPPWKQIYDKLTAYLNSISGNKFLCLQYTSLAS